MESLLRSALLVLMDNATAEYTFVTTFFSPDTSQVPVRKEPPMSPPTVHASQLSMVQDDETGAPAGTLSASNSTPLTVDTNSNPVPIYSLARGATPQPNLPVQLSKEDQAALNAVWKQITDPAVEYTQVSTHLRDLCSNLNAGFPWQQLLLHFSPLRPNKLPTRPSSNHAWSRSRRSFPCLP